ncbi:hypothetical protein B0I21_102401 [Sphingobacterium paludis]|uniref:Uncharacterized protein n=1 Tax=Sphingobacterium paludis TaxID=1476465 RepID=A0A4R7DAI4_9SPHI|nr:hypothetical protein B0I21_102401 [Sphingobacterium paludis]
MNISIAIPSLLLSVIAFVSCKKAESVRDELVGKVEYRLSSLHSHEPMDLNFDGVKSSDLLREIPSFYNKPLYINFDIRLVNVLWMEPSYTNKHIGFLHAWHLRSLCSGTKPLSF